MKVQNLPFCCALLALFFCCNNKQPFKPDYESGVGMVIGHESCSSDPLKNAWLIQFIGPFTTADKVFENITYNNKRYDNVVKTYNLPDTVNADGKTYHIDFNIEPPKTQKDCDVETPTVFDVTNIRIKNFYKTTVHY